MVTIFRPIGSMVALSALAAAQTANGQTDDASTANDIIVVTATPLRGLVIGDIPSELELDARDVAGYGASSIEDLLSAIAPQTGSARGRGGGRPVILLNGQRISSFREIRDLPPEAIERVQVFPEELALRYGYRPDQRVVNFILKPNFASFSAEAEHGVATQGGYSASEFEATLTRIGESGRLNTDVEYKPVSQLLESERGIVQPRTGDLGLADNGDFRTLIPASDTIEINANINRKLSDTTSLTLSGEYSHGNSRALLGLPSASLIVPATSPFARRAIDETVLRYLPAAGGALARGTETSNAEAGLTANGLLGEWRWSLTGNYNRALTITDTERAPDTAGLAARIAAGDPLLDPFAPTLGAGLGFTRDTARSLSQTADANFTIAGSPMRLPAGPLTLSATSGFEWRAIDSRANTGGLVTRGDLDRQRGFVRVNIDVPVTSRREAFGDFIGDLTLNANFGYGELSDFGGLVEYGYGLNWEPIGGLSFLASVIGEQAAPTVQQLGNPVIVTPNVSIFDFANGTSVFADRITGGNPALLTDDRRDFKLGVNYHFGDNPDVRLIAEYIRNRSDNVTSDFPLLTPEIEAAFPDRVIRDGAGNLVRIDARPVNFAQVRGERIRYGVNLSGRLGGGEERGAGRRGGGRQRSDADQAGAPRGPRGGRATGESGGEAPAPADQASAAEATPRPTRQPDPRSFLRRGGGGDGGRWQLSAYHTWRLDETVLVRPGVTELDLLDGSVTGSSTPTARHSVEMEGGLFINGVGLRASAEYTGSARIDGSGLPGSSDLFFGDIFTLNLRAFFNFDSRENLVEDVPFLRGSRLALRVDNIFDGVQRVTDSNGEVPLAYQPGFLNPRGRYVELSFRKRF